MNTRWTVEYKMNGFICTLQIETGDSGEVMTKAAAALDYLQKQGAVPAADPAPVINTANMHPAADGPPTCPVHGTPMKRSKINDGWFCSRKLGDGTYCQAKVEG